MHIIDDFVLQTQSLNLLKQKSWWEKECHLHNISFDKYKFDYIMALILHGLSWSIMVHLPIIFFYNIKYEFLLILSIILMGALHSIIDNLKANKQTINLCTDQLLHLLQIIVIWGTFQ